MNDSNKVHLTATSPIYNLSDMKLDIPNDFGLISNLIPGRDVYQHWMGQNPPNSEIENKKGIFISRKRVILSGPNTYPAAVRAPTKIRRTRQMKNVTPIKFELP